MKKISTAIVVAGISVSLLAGCGSKDKDDKTAATSAPSSATVEEVVVEESPSGTDTEVAVVEESATAMSDDAMSDDAMSDDAMSESASASAGAAAPAATAAAGEYVSPDGAYSVNFPAPPTVAGDGTTAQLPDGSTFTIATQPAANTDIDNEVKGATAVLGEPKNLKDVDLDGRKGKRFDFEMTTGPVKMAGTAMIVIDGDTAYAVMGMSATGDTAAPTAFVDSFKFLK